MKKILYAALLSFLIISVSCSDEPDEQEPPTADANTGLTRPGQGGEITSGGGSGNLDWSLSFNGYVKKKPRLATKDKEGARIPVQKMKCTIDMKKGVRIGRDKTEVIVYEIRDSETNALLCDFIEERSFIMRLIMYPKIYYVNIVTPEYIYYGEIAPDGNFGGLYTSF